MEEEEVRALHHVAPCTIHNVAPLWCHHTPCSTKLVPPMVLHHTCIHACTMKHHEAPCSSATVAPCRAMQGGGEEGVLDELDGRRMPPTPCRPSNASASILPRPLIAPPPSPGSSAGETSILRHKYHSTRCLARFMCCNGHRGGGTELGVGSYFMRSETVIDVPKLRRSLSSIRSC